MNGSGARTRKMCRITRFAFRWYTYDESACDVIHVNSARVIASACKDRTSCAKTDRHRHAINHTLCFYALVCGAALAWQCVWKWKPVAFAHCTYYCILYMYVAYNINSIYCAFAVRRVRKYNIADWRISFWLYYFFSFLSLFSLRRTTDGWTRKESLSTGRD